MRKIEDSNPAAVFFYFFAVVFVTMFSQNPVISSVSLIGSVVFFSALKIRNAYKSHLFSLILFLILTLINPLFSKSGETALFFFNDRPITLEALLYGANAAASFVAALYWLRCFSRVMTSDKLLYVFSKLSKKLALILTVSLRFIPLFREQYRRIDNAQRALGLYKNDNVIDTLKGKARVTDILITWVLEGGIITAESMEARGYDTGRRSAYSRFRFFFSDAVLLVLSAAFGALSVIAAVRCDFSFYPSIRYTGSALVTAGYISFGALAALPILINTQEVLRWKYLTSRI